MFIQNSWAAISVSIQWNFCGMSLVEAFLSWVFRSLNSRDQCHKARKKIFCESIIRIIKVLFPPPHLVSWHMLWPREQLVEYYTGVEEILVKFVLAKSCQQVVYKVTVNSQKSLSKLSMNLCCVWDFSINSYLEFQGIIFQWNHNYETNKMDPWK